MDLVAIVVGHGPAAAPLAPRDGAFHGALVARRLQSLPAEPVP